MVYLITHCIPTLCPSNLHISFKYLLSNMAVKQTEAPQDREVILRGVMRLCFYSTSQK